MHKHEHCQVPIPLHIAKLDKGGRDESEQREPIRRISDAKTKKGNRVEERR